MKDGFLSRSFRRHSTSTPGEGIGSRKTVNNALWGHSKDQKSAEKPPSPGREITSISSPGAQNEPCNPRNISITMPAIQSGLAPSSSRAQNASPLNAPDADYDPYFDMLSVAESIPLSEAETLRYNRRQHLELQDVYEDNFTHYLPFVMRRMRKDAQKAEEGANFEPDSPNSSDDATILEDTQLDSSLVPILGRHTSMFTHKRTFIVAGELLKSVQYLFASPEAFATFKRLRAKPRRKSLVGYGEDAKISTSEKSPVSDTRQHIVPLEDKAQGMGMPLLKIQVPYMSSFRKKTPFMVFRRYREVPLPPSHELQDDDDFETYEFCQVYVKHFQKFKRYIFKFTPLNGPLVRFLAFQNNYRPYSDFNYANTRFRVIGSALSNGHLTPYNPNMKLAVVDSALPSLCDIIINKKKSQLLPLKGKKKDDEKEVVGSNDPVDLPNPYPSSENPLYRDLEFFFDYGRNGRMNEYVPDNMPPFGNLIDGTAYAHEKLLLPKRFSEAAKMDLYQDAATFNGHDPDSTLSVDTDLLVLACVLLALREASVRSSNGTTKVPFAGRMTMPVSEIGTFGGGTLGTM